MVNKTNWTNVIEKLPKINTEVMVKDAKGNTMLDHLNEQNKWIHSEIVYWMPLEDFVHSLFVL